MYEVTWPKSHLFAKKYFVNAFQLFENIKKFNKLKQKIQYKKTG